MYRNRKFTVDEYNKNIIMNKKYILFGKRRIIPFSEVESIHIERYYTIDAYGTKVRWCELALYCRNGRRMKIRKANNGLLLKLPAEQLGKCLGKKIINDETEREYESFIGRILREAQEDQDRMKPPSTRSGL